MPEVLLFLPKFIQYCKDLSDAVIIVEGKRDIETLRRLGISNKIIQRGGLSFDKLADRVYQFSTIIILTDFDAKGKRLRSQIKKEIQKRKGHGRIDPLPRQFLYKLCRAYKISEIEDLDRFVGKV
ncbi:MAG: toprim domain-containing protein [Candidatus Hodarchaeota archaeon]